MGDISHGGKPTRISERELLRTIWALFCLAIWALQSPTSPLALTKATPVLSEAAVTYPLNKSHLFFSLKNIPVLVQVYRQWNVEL